VFLKEIDLVVGTNSSNQRNDDTGAVSESNNLGLNETVKLTQELATQKGRFVKSFFKRTPHKTHQRTIWCRISIK